MLYLLSSKVSMVPKRKERPLYKMALKVFFFLEKNLRRSLEWKVRAAHDRSSVKCCKSDSEKNPFLSFTGKEPEGFLLLRKTFIFHVHKNHMEVQLQSDFAVRKSGRALSNSTYHLKLLNWALLMLMNCCSLLGLSFVFRKILECCRLSKRPQLV